MPWKQFCEENAIPYIRGGNKNGGNILIRCPMCGVADLHGKPSMSLHNISPAYRCWSNQAEHKGMNPVTLIALLLRCSHEEAEVHAKKYFRWTPKDQIAKDINAVKNLYIPFEAPKEFNIFKFNDTYNGPIEIEKYRYQHHFTQYLENRDLDPKYICQRYNLRWCIDSIKWIHPEKRKEVLVHYEWRIIIPIFAPPHHGYAKDSKYYTYTSRSINPNEPLRYLSCHDSKGQPSDFLLDYQNLNGGDVLIVYEGPFDAFKAAMCMISGISVTCLFTNTLTLTQQSALIRLASKYEAVAIMLDKSEWAKSMKIANDLCWYAPNVFPFRLASGKDMGELSIEAATQELEQLSEMAKKARFARQRLLATGGPEL